MKIIELTKHWRFKKAAARDMKESAKTELENPPDEEGWLPAKVPGHVHLDLMAHNKIPDPFLEDNEYQAQWVEEAEWIYECRFDLPDSMKKAKKSGSGMNLVLEGVDAYCSIFLNRKKIAVTSNMFLPLQCDISSLVQEKGNELLFYFQSAVKVSRELEKRHGTFTGPCDTARMYARRAQYMTGWDWGPRLSGVGVWRPVKISLREKATLHHVGIATREISPDKSSASLDLDIMMSSEKSEEMALSCDISIRGERKTGFQKTVSIGKGNTPLKETVKVENPELWYPNGFGKQPLYSLSVKLSQGKKTVDQWEGTFGIRTIKLNQEQDQEGKKFVFEINGEPIFLKGMNWIPADSFPARLTEEDYKKWIELVADTNANCLRVWGGGIYEHEAFYRLCDEKGICVWQDFMFACGAYPEEDWFLATVKEEARAQVMRLMNHPSIVLWCGNNENEWMLSWKRESPSDALPGDKIFLEVLPEICGEIDPQRPYWPSSPHGGHDPNSPAEGDRHNWEVWSNWKRFEEYTKDNGRFLSEFGFQAVPRNRTIFSFTKERDHNLNTPALQNHQKMIEGNSRLFRYLWAYLMLPKNLDELSYYSQLLQGEALKMGVQSWRSRKFDTAGSLIWQINDCWPVISWSLVDYYKRPKASYYYARRFYAPLSAALIFDSIGEFNFSRPGNIQGKVRCVIVNDLPEEIEGEIYLNVFNLKGEKIFEKILNKTVPANGVLKIGNFSLSDLWITQAEREFVTLRFIREGKVLTMDTHLFIPWKYISFLKPDWRRTKIKKLSGREFEISLTSKVFIKCVKIFLNQEKWEASAREQNSQTTPPPIPEYRLDDNFFDLIPHQEKRLLCAFDQEVPEELFRASLTFQSLNDSFSS
ncbi:glycoside hydrolase family 2 protein [Candidatus Sumerlaeota bacterium]|nr:glycoside hydrolase family 2 protein [Candidatus Sumerlaeota bacterium]